MKSLTEYLSFRIPTRVGFLNITPEVAESVRKSKVGEGLVLVNAMHITASVFINDDEPGLLDDYARVAGSELAPFDRFARLGIITTAPARTTPTPT